MMSILSLVILIVLVAAMPRTGNSPSGQRPPSRDVRAPVARKSKPNGQPGVVTYALMEDKKLPSPAQRAFRRLSRPFAWLRGRPAKPRHDIPATDGDAAKRQSAELQNFIDARNREIARRKAEGHSKPGPDDRLH